MCAAWNFSAKPVHKSYGICWRYHQPSGFSIRSNQGYETVCIYLHRKYGEAATLIGPTDGLPRKPTLAEAADLLTSFSIEPSTYFLENVRSIPTVMLPGIYSIITFESLHYLHVVVSILLKHFTMRDYLFASCIVGVGIPTRNVLSLLVPHSRMHVTLC